MIDALTPEAIDRLLASETVARLGCHADGRTYVVPISYVYANGTMYGHMSDGMKLRMLRINPEICIEIDRVETLSRWKSVIAWGTFDELSGDAARDAAETIMRQLHPSLTGGNTTDAQIAQLVALMLSRGVVFRIALREKTGRFEEGLGAPNWLAAGGH
jgi:nitroimidazol reductase NimA-like FMN-containing flavoprotein (pyridoxamine 5'-phosphate oxidase superfamily)